MDIEKLSLGDLIDKLKEIEGELNGSERNVYFDFCGFHPSGVDSWRGSYDELAIEFDDEGDLSINEFINLLSSAAGLPILEAGKRP